MTLKMVGDFLQRDHTALSRYERAEWPIRRAEVVALLNLYDCHRTDERDHLLRLAEDVWHAEHWAEEYRDIVDGAFVDFPWLESQARRVCSYHSALVPGLFQLREYAELVIRNAEGAAATATKVTRWVDLRLQRQRMLTAPTCPEIATVIDETALRRKVGGAALMRAQLDHLVTLARQPNIEIRILPNHVSLHAGLDGSFWLFNMPDGYPMVGYLESLAGHIYVESPGAQRFLAAFDRMRGAALDPGESAKLISAVAEELS